MTLNSSYDTSRITNAFDQISYIDLSEYFVVFSFPGWPFSIYYKFLIDVAHGISVKI